MCGIIGIIGRENVTEYMVEALKRLEYRGYDSAGVATIHDGKISRCRAEGKIKNLEKALEANPIAGTIGIGHTRWATHGVPTEKNAHPHATQKVAVVHNGIIENYLELRAELEGKGYKFNSDTDTEVIPQLITFYLDSGIEAIEACKLAVRRLHGAYAIAVIFADNPNLMVAARHGSPLVIGFEHFEADLTKQNGQKFIGSDAMALIGLTQNICYLDEGDLAVLTPEKVEIFDKFGRTVQRQIDKSNLSSVTMGKENYRHFMLKEIFEQPSVLSDNIHAYFNSRKNEFTLPELPFDLAQISKITIIACGTSYYAGKVAGYWFERIAKIKTEVDIASEFRYRDAIMEPNGMAVFISQSGETADTLAALRYAKEQGQKIVSVVNVLGSSMARESDVVLPIYCGPEIGVASTKAFTTQLMTLSFLMLAAARAKGTKSEEIIRNSANQLLEIPQLVSLVLEEDKKIQAISAEISNAKDVIYIGRGVSYPLAMEGALKLKEISYIHAEATAAGELKHGPIALIDESVPVIAIAPFDDLFEKTASNIREVAARGGRIIVISDRFGIKALEDIAAYSIELPSIDCSTISFACQLAAPIIYSIPIQLLAYHIAVLKGTDVDQPRNLAKSVTVE
jgi:glucosamine--fructose-6-phosphate aminotransferase (isomerizing)